jgi:hypothetical protein
MTETDWKLEGKTALFAVIVLAILFLTYVVVTVPVVAMAGPAVLLVGLVAAAVLLVRSERIVRD